MKNIEIHFEDFGKDSDLPVVFIHGLGAHSGQIRSSLDSLVTTSGIRLITPDMPGHGNSKLPDGGEYSFEYFVEQIHQLTENLGLEHFVLGGLSMGSAISLAYSLRYPEKVQKLILLRPSWMDSKQPTHLEIVARVGRWIQEKGVKEAEEILQKDESFQSLSPYSPKVQSSVSGLFNRPQAETATSVLYKMWEDRPFANIDFLQDIKIPSLVLSSPRDPLHPVSVAELIFRHLRNSTYELLPSRYDEPDLHNQILIEKVQAFINN